MNVLAVVTFRQNKLKKSQYTAIAVRLYGVIRLAWARTSGTSSSCAILPFGKQARVSFENNMTSQLTIEQARKTQETQVERLRKLQRDKQTASPDQQSNIQRDIEGVDQEIRNLDTVIQGLLSQRR